MWEYIIVIAIIYIFYKSYKKDKKEQAEFQDIFIDAELGDAEAQYEVAIRFLEGRGITRNIKEALKFCSMSAEQGHIKAQRTLEDLRVKENRKDKSYHDTNPNKIKPTFTQVSVWTTLGPDKNFYEFLRTSDSFWNIEYIMHQIDLKRFSISELDVVIAIHENPNLDCFSRWHIEAFIDEIYSERH